MKSHINRYILLALICISSQLGCSDNNPLVNRTVFTIDNFPHEIGTVWQYQTIGKAIISTDSLFVRIADTTRITDDSLLVSVVVTRFINQYTESTDTIYWHFDSDTLTYYKVQLGTYVKDRKIIFPLKLDKTWSTGSSPIDTNIVNQIAATSVLDTYYPFAVQINRNGQNSEIEIDDEYWYVPDIGMVYSDILRKTSRLNLGYVWSLVSFYHPDSVQLSNLPIQKGASWNYRVYNNFLDCVNCYDSVSVSILDSLYNGLGSITESWYFDYPNQETIIKDSLVDNKLFLQWHHHPLFFSLEFPLHVGDTWFDNANFRVSSVEVIGRKTITTPAGTFKDAYYLKGRSRILVIGQEIADFELWIAKDYGIVKLKHRSEGNGSFEDKSWELQSYNLNDSSAIFTIDQFPNYNGMTRSYEKFDYNTTTYDTVLVQVAESSTVAIWNYTNSDSSWQEIVSLEGTVAKFFYPDNIIEPYKSYAFPIELGKSWTTYPLGNSSSVYQVTPLILPAGRFSPCYGIETIFNCDGCQNSEIEWVHPSIGMILKIFRRDGSTIERWQLIEYSNP